MIIIHAVLLNYAPVHVCMDSEWYFQQNMNWAYHTKCTLKCIM